MKLNIAVQMDPIARINIRGDSTFALLLEAQKRGHGMSYYTPDKLSLRGEELVAPVQALTVRDEAGDHFTLGEPRREPLAPFDVILLRQDPPFDLAYITSTHLLERHASEDAGRQRSRQRAQRAGKDLRDGFSESDAADADLARPRRDQRVPRRARRGGDEAAARPWRRRGVSRHAAGHEFRLAVRHVLGDVQGALGDPALPSRGQARRQAHHPGRRRIRRRRQPRAGGGRSALQHGARRRGASDRTVRRASARSAPRSARAARARVVVRRHRRHRRPSHRDQRDLADRHSRHRAARRPGCRREDLGRDRGEAERQTNFRSPARGDEAAIARHPA